MEKYCSILSWLIDNHPSYSDMTCPQACPQPVLIGGFAETQNNTDDSDGSMAELESSFDGERWMFASSNEPTESSGASSIVCDIISEGRKIYASFQKWGYC